MAYKEIIKDMTTFRKFLCWLRDRIIPSIEGENSERTLTNHAVKEIISQEILDAAIFNLKDEIEQENDRSKTADTRLNAILGQSPIIITIVVAIVTFLLSDKRNSFTTTSISVVLVAAFYIIVQYLLAVLFSIRGLKSRAYRRNRPADLLPNGDEDILDYLKRCFQSLSDILETNQETNNGKLDQMNLAHEALLNAIFGLFILFVALGIVAFHG